MLGIAQELTVYSLTLLAHYGITAGTTRRIMSACSA